MAKTCCQDVIGHHYDCPATPKLPQPTEEGFHWYRKDDQHSWSIMEVWKEHGQWCCAQNKTLVMEHNFTCNFDGEWIGPLTPPTT